MGIEEYLDPVTGEKRYRVKTVVRHHGQRKQRQVSGIKSPGEAQRVLSRIRNEANREIIETELRGLCWGELVLQWNEAMVRGEAFEKPVTVNTINDYYGTVTLYTASWNSMPLQDITRLDIKKALEFVTQSGRSGSRKKFLKIALKCAFQWAIDSGVAKGMKENPVRGIPLGRIEEKKPGILTLSQARSLLSSAQNIGHPWYPIWAGALLTGMRSGELFALEWANVDFENKLIHVSQSYNTKGKCIKSTKSGYHRMVPMGPDVESLLRSLCDPSKASGYVFPRFTDWQTGAQANVLRQFCKGLGLPLIKFHDLRACFATYLLRDAVAPAQVMRICGWKDLKTMQRYLRLSAVEIQGATDGLKLLPGREVMGRVFSLINGNKF